ncbi:MAG: glycosyltransferase family 4 protein [Micrococcales bacterium]
MERIFFDARYIRVDHHDGISRYSAGLIWALNARTKVVAIISDKRQLTKLPLGIDYVLATSPTSWREPFLAFTLNRLGAKLVYSPMQTIGSLGRKFKLVLTLHDLIYYRHPTPPPSLSWPIRVGWRLYHLSYTPQRIALNRADAVVTVSETTKRLMLEHRLTKRPIQVVYNAAGNLSEQYEHKAPLMRPRDQQDLVYMGSFMDYKNVECLIEAMAYLPEYRLNLLSAITSDRRAELERLVSPEGGTVMFHNGVSEARYHEILDSSVALVSASRDEGFGIPLIEAMARGIPVAVSDIGIFREIAADAGSYFDPEKPESLAAVIRRLESTSTWLEASRNGLSRAKLFSWGTSAKSLLSALATI